MRGRDARDRQRLARFHAHVRAGETGRGYDLTWWIFVRPLLAAYRVRALDADHVPAAGPVILAPNHASYLDHFLLAGIAGRRLSFMAKSQIFRWPLSLTNRLGAFPVRQGSRDEDAFLTAHAVLGRGGCLVLYCEGGIARDGMVRERAKPGIGRLALESGAPVVPVALLDTHRIRGLRFPTVTARFGKPLAFDRLGSPSREDQQHVADAVLADIKALHGSLVAIGHAAARKAGATTGARYPGRAR